MSTQEKSILNGVMFTVITLILFLPSLSFSGSLEPSDLPGPTMRTLDEIYSTNSWSKKLPCDSTTNCPRFEILADFNNEAVLDKETGLVWQKSPTNYQGNWWHAQWQCFGRFTGGRGGWRVPTIHELLSLMDSCDNYPHYLPCGHPFTNLNYCYWSSTEWPLDFNEAIYFCPNVGYGPVEKTQLNSAANWCVRGGLGVELGVSFHY